MKLTTNRQTDPPPPDRQRKFTFRMALFATLVCLSGFGAVQWPWNRSHRSATGIPKSYSPHGDELFLDDGRVDYCATLNQILSETIRTKENAVVDYLLFVGDGLLTNSEHRPAFLHTIGMLESDFSKSVPFVRSFGTCYSRGRPESDVATVPWKSENEYPTFAAWLDHQPQVPALIRAAAAKPFFHPLIGRADPQIGTATMNAVLPIVSEMRNLAEILCVESMRELGRGNSEIPLANTIAIRNMSWQLNHTLTLIENLVASALLEKSQSLCLELLRSGKLNRNQLDELSASLQLNPGELLVTPAIDRAERYMVLDAIQAADWEGVCFDQYSTLSQARGLKPTTSTPGWAGFSRFVDWGTTLETVNVWFDQQIETIELMEAKGNYSELELLGIAPDFSSGNGVKDFMTNVFSSKIRGQYQAAELLNLILPAAKAAMIASVSRRQRQQLLLAAIAVEKYRWDTGGYPQNLELLVPKYLPNLPRDAYRPNQQIQFAIDERSYKLFATGRPANCPINQEAIYQIEIPRLPGR